MRRIALLVPLVVLVFHPWHATVWSEDPQVPTAKTEVEVLAAAGQVRQELESLRNSYLWKKHDEAYLSELAAGLTRRGHGTSRLVGAIDSALLQMRKDLVDLEKKRDALLECSKWIEARGYNLRKSAFVDLEEQLKKQQDGDEFARAALDTVLIAPDTTSLRPWEDAKDTFRSRRREGKPLVEKKVEKPVERPVDRGAAANHADEIQVLFSPNGGIRDRIVKECSLAKTRIVIQAYDLTSPEIIDALIEAAERGITVGIILDKNLGSEANTEGLDKLKRSKALLFIDSADKAHSKVIIIDERMVITGSYNFSRSAESKNVENALFIASQSIVQEYLGNWATRYKMSTPLPR